MNTPPSSSGGDGEGIPFGSFNRQTQNEQNQQTQAQNQMEAQIYNGNPMGYVFGSPYYINPSENLGQSIVSELLNENNYQMWQRAIRMVLKTKHKVGFIDGSLPMPERTHPEFVVWDASNTIVLCWILNSVDKDIRRSVLQHDIAQALWDELKQRFGSCNALRLANLKEAIAQFKQGSLSVTQYYVHLKGLWEEYLQFNPIVDCDCVAIRTRPCAAVEAFKERQETEYLIKFLRGLRPEFDVVQTQLLMMKPLPSVQAAVDDILQHEQKIKSDKGHSTRNVLSVALAAQGDKQKGYTSFEPGNGGRDNAEGERKFCRYCKKEGHLKEECYKLKNKKARMAGENSFAGAVAQSDSESKDSSSTVSNPSLETKSSQSSQWFTNEEFTKLKSLLQADSMSPSPPLSPSLKHAAYSVTQHLPQFPNFSGKFVLSSHNQYGLMGLAQVWILDTGASDHICCTLSLLTDARPTVNQFVYLPNGSKVPVSHIGTVRLHPGFYLQNVLLVPSFTFNLISVSKITHDLPLSLHFESDSCHIQDLVTKKLIGFARQSRGLYHLFPNIPALPQHHTAATYNFQPHQIELWHWRLGHPSKEREQQLTGCNRTIVRHCETCHLAKQRKLSFPLSTSRAHSIFDLIHVDIWGPLAVESYDGYSYFLTIVDDHSRAVWTYLMRLKSETSRILEAFCVMVSRQFGKLVKVIRSDQGSEFHMAEFYSTHGIEHQTSCVETPEQNARVERKHQHILNVARALRFQAGLPLEFWSDCILHAVHLINRLPSPVIHDLTPFELLYNKPPVLSHLKVFGCLAYASTLLRDRTKFHPRARQCMFLGFLPGVKGYKLFDLHTHDVFVSRHVMFHETIFPFKQTSSTNSSSPDPTTSTFSPSSSSSQTTSLFPNHSPIPDDLPSLVPSPNSQNTSQPFSSSSMDSLSSTPISSNTFPSLNPHFPSSSSSHTPSPSHSFPTATNHPSPAIDWHDLYSDGEELCAQEPIDEGEDHGLRKSTRVKTKPVWHKDFTFSGATTSHSIQNFVSFDKLPESHKIFVLSVMHAEEPKTYAEACKELVWRLSMNEEMDALIANDTWDEVILPEGKKAIDNKWVYKIKHKADGSIERHKSRLVVKGFTQIYGIDFLDTFSPVAKINSVKALLAVTASQDWHIHQMDVANAFLHGDLNEEVYMKPPPGVVVSDPRIVFKLKKSLYGLKQASRQWFAKLTASLLKNGFSQAASDYSMFIRRFQGRMLVVLVYVDDILIAGSSLSDIEQTKGFLGKEFKVKDLGVLKFFLGLEVYRDHRGIFVNQRKYCMDLLEETGHLEAKDCLSPADCKVQLRAKQGEPLTNPEVYKRLVGRLHYLIITPPDLTHSVQQLCQFQKDPHTEHLQAAYRVIRYIKHAPGQGLWFKSGTKLELTGFSDSDWASCPDTRRSVTGYCTLLGGCLLTWKSKKQTTVSRSSSEAEYRALAHLVCELEWLRSLLAEMGINIPLPIDVYCDNRSAIHIAENPVFHERTKHIEIDCHVTRERLSSGMIKLQHVRTDDQLADLFTKGLTRYRLSYLLDKLGVFDMYSPTYGGVTEQKAQVKIEGKVQQ
ncbi:unnamed protein product [Linum trigynum]|uniref:Integrase catalytic domain-containing protein n=1 Tax=Linum trigynum TaxID=586398 RepID=A0AAV2GGK0_9ROSI